MPRVNVLPREISELIAAGEVIERPSSVIKELVENSIDSGAKNIIVEIQNGGVTFMRVTDDGCGFYRSDIKNAFLRHATSKISTGDDLYKKGTLGFRGEALTSICAVARVELLTKSIEEKIGSSYKISYDEESEVLDAGCPDGTTIIVRDLFYNVPARMKFLKKDVSEGNSVATVIEKIAISHPDVAFKFIRDGKLKLQTFGDGNLLSAIKSCYGLEVAQNMLPVDISLDNISVEGYITKPTHSQSTRRLQNFFVNGRYVQTRTAMAALEEGYRNSIMKGKFPGCFLNIKVPFQDVDVNVHPAKIEVRFTNEKPIFSAVYNGVKQALAQVDLTQGDEISKSVKSMTFSKQPKGFGQRELTPEQMEFIFAPRQPKEEVETICYKRFPKSRSFFTSNVAKSYYENTGKDPGETFFEVPVHDINISMNPIKPNGKRRIENIGLVDLKPSVLLPKNVEVLPQILPDEIDAIRAKFGVNKNNNSESNKDLSIPYESAPSEKDKKAKSQENLNLVPKNIEPLPDKKREEEDSISKYLPDEIERDAPSVTDIYTMDFKKQCTPKSDFYEDDFDYGDDDDISDVDPNSIVDFSLAPLDMIDIKQGKDDEHRFDMFIEFRKKQEAGKINAESYKRFDGYKYIGELFKTYILMEKDEMVILVDKHAAHERLIYNKFRSEYEEKSIERQILLQPITRTYSMELHQIAIENKDFLQQFGYDFDDFGDNEIIIREVPMIFEPMDGCYVFDDMLLKILDNNTVSIPDLLDDMLHIMSCKMAIKANDNNKPEELLEIIRQLDLNPYVNFCPHGRPIMKAISKYSFSKLFKRT